MLQKLFIKVGILLFALAMVVAAINFFSSLEFKMSVKNFFGVEVKTFHWCSTQVNEMTWQDEAIAPKWKTASQAQLEARFCTVSMEPIRNQNLKEAHFTSLLKAGFVDGKSAVLEWDRELNLFKADGLPFYSPSLQREILDR